VPWHNGALFGAQTTAGVAQLFLTGGTPATTRQLSHSTATAGLNPNGLTAYDGKVYFYGNDNAHEGQLWSTNGTASGTTLVKDINGASASNPGDFVVAGNTLFFAAYTSTDGQELWATHGTSATTHLVKDLNPGPAGSSPADLTAVGNDVYFRATTSTDGTELWRSNGTAAGTVQVADINAGSASSTPNDIALAGSTLFFTAGEATHGRELWAEHVLAKPGAPTLKVTSAHKTSISLRITAPKSDGGAPLFGYAVTVLKCRPGHKHCSLKAVTTKKVGPGTHTLTVKKLAKKTVYYFRAVTANQIGLSPKSATVHKKTT
jgi:ELWxxDGT repeat protein